MIDIKAIRERCEALNLPKDNLREDKEFLKNELRSERWTKEFTEFAVEAISDIPALLDELETAQNAQRWISVTERLPKDDECVLICALDVNDGGKEITISAYSEAVFGGKKLGYKRWSEPYQYFSRQHKVTHWMPLPEPPKGEE